MTKLNLTENELAERWGISPKTLQRWRSEKRGPSYLKLSKRVTYPIEDILAFERSQKIVGENSHEVSVQGVNVKSDAHIEDATVPGNPKVGLVAQSNSVFITGTEVARATKLPSYYFTRENMRAQLEIPHYLVGTQVRFQLDDIRQWEKAKARQSIVTPIGPVASIFENAKATPHTNDPYDQSAHRDGDKRPTHANGDTSIAPALSSTESADPQRTKMHLHEALRRLNEGTLPRSD